MKGGVPLTTFGKKIHVEYTCDQEVLEQEKESISKRIARSKRLWIGYVSLMIISIFFLPLWMSFLILLSGILLIPGSLLQKEMIAEKPFLVIDSKYLQSKGRTIAWSSVKKIQMKRHRLSHKGTKYNYRLSISYMSDREVSFDTCYFKDQEDIIQMLKQLAIQKNIPFEEVMDMSQKGENEAYNN